MIEILMIDPLMLVENQTSLIKYQLNTKEKSFNRPITNLSTSLLLKIFPIQSLFVIFVRGLTKSFKTKITGTCIYTMLVLCLWYANSVAKQSKYLLIRHILLVNAKIVNTLKNVLVAKNLSTKVLTKFMSRRNSVFQLNRQQ